MNNLVNLPTYKQIQNSNLIAEIKKRPELWNNSKTSKGKTRDLRVSLWNEVASIAGIETVEEAKRRWDILRDIFRREYKRGKSESNKYKSQWFHFEKMTFLLDVINFKNNIKSTNIPMDLADAAENYAQNLNEISDQKHNPIDITNNISIINEIKEEPISIDDDFRNESTTFNDEEKKIINVVPQQNDNKTFSYSNNQIYNKINYSGNGSEVENNITKCENAHCEKSCDYPNESIDDNERKLLMGNKRKSLQVARKRTTQINTNNLALNSRLTPIVESLPSTIVAKDPISTIPITFEANKINYNSNADLHKELVETSDYHFALSLIPFMETVPEPKKLRMRSRLIQILIEENTTENIN